MGSSHPLDRDHRYDDIIDLPHHVSKKRKPMDRLSRAAQFSPFAALTGFDSYIGEEGRYTSSRAELDEEQKARIDESLRYIAKSETGTVSAVVTFFLRDGAKEGGAYVSVSGAVRSVDAESGTLEMTTGETIPVGEIYSLTVDGTP